MNFKSIFVFLFLILPIIAIAQVKEGHDDNTIIDEIPYFNAHVPSPPDLNSFTDYSNSVTNNMYTGTMNFSIPIATIVSNNYSHSVTLSYASNGIRNFEINMPRWGDVWTISAGGYIARTVNDEPDDKDGVGLLNTWWYDKIANYNLTQDEQLALANQYYDSEPDVFSYNFDGYSGEFYIIKENDSKEVILNPQENLKIVPNYEDNIEIIGFTITTENGLIYHFDKPELTDYTVSNADVQHRITQYISKWYLTSIEDLNSNVLLSFEYFSVHIDYDAYNLYSQVFLLDTDFNNGYKHIGSLDNIENYNDSTYILHKIIGPNSIIEFDTNYNPDRSHPFASSYIKIYERKGEDIVLEKKYDILYTSIGTKVFINEVDVNDSNGILVYGYTFDYYDDHPFYTNYDDNIKHRDLWGFFKGAESIYPQIKLSGINIENDLLYDKSFDREYAKTGLLKSIKFPTGGKAVITYEPHRFTVQNGWREQFPFLNSNNIITGAGFRVKKIQYFDSNNEPLLQKEYEYEGGEQFSYPDFYTVSHYFEAVKRGFSYVWRAREKVAVSLVPVIPFTTVNGSLVGYDKVLSINATEVVTSGVIKYPYIQSAISSVGEVKVRDIIDALEGEPEKIINSTVLGEKSIQQAAVQTAIGTISGYSIKGYSHSMPKTTKNLFKNGIPTFEHGFLWNRIYNSINQEWLKNEGK